MDKCVERKKERKKGWAYTTITKQEIVVCVCVCAQVKLICNPSRDLTMPACVTD